MADLLRQDAPAGSSPAGDERRAEAMRALARFVGSRDLEVAAVFLWEAARPFHLLVQQAFLVAHPLLRPWFGDRLLLWADLLAEPEALERALHQDGARADKQKWPTGCGDLRGGDL